MSPAKLQTLLQQAVTHHQAGRLTEADRLYAQVRSAAPKNVDGWHLAGVVAFQQGRAADAIDLLTRALRLDPKSAVCEMRLGLAYIVAGQLAEAEARLRNVLKRTPDFAAAWDNLAYCLKATNRVDEAIAAHRRAVEADPKFVAGWNNLGSAYGLLGRTGEALAAHERALKLEPHSPEARMGHGQALQQAHRIEEAVAEYGEALALQPQKLTARSNRLMALNYLASTSREMLFKEHLAYGAAADAQPGKSAAQLAPPPRPTDRGARLRVAFLSPDLRGHSVAYFLEPLLRHLNRDAFEIVLYHDHFVVDATSERLRSLASVWRNFVGQADAVVEGAIRADAPDILVDLAGHTGLNRLPLFARRLAPVQISYLGYPNTTGLRAMDFRFVDAVTDPSEEDQRFHSEKLVRFAPTAWTYEPPRDAPTPALPLVGGVPHPLPAITFGSFNSFSKVSDQTLRLWSRVLAAVPGSRLLLKSLGLSDPAVRTYADDKLRRAGIDASRAELFERAPSLNSHLELYSKLHVALDTFPYHGTTTTCEALWMGVPVVTLYGDRHAARVSASLLAAAGHPEWIAHSEDEYVRIAAELARDASRLAQLRSTLRDDLRRGPLLDHAAQAARFGAALQQCWQERTSSARA